MNLMQEGPRTKRPAKKTGRDKAGAPANCGIADFTPRRLREDPVKTPRTLESELWKESTRERCIRRAR